MIRPVWDRRLDGLNGGFGLSAPYRVLWVTESKLKSVIYFKLCGTGSIFSYFTVKFNRKEDIKNEQETL